MADIENRKLVSYGMTFEFVMTEHDRDGEPIRTVSMVIATPDDITHNEVTESYHNFLTACGFVLSGGEVRYVRDKKDEDEEEDGDY